MLLIYCDQSYLFTTQMDRHIHIRTPCIVNYKYQQIVKYIMIGQMIMFFSIVVI